MLVLKSYVAIIRWWLEVLQQNDSLQGHRDKHIITMQWYPINVMTKGGQWVFDHKAKEDVILYAKIAFM